MNVWWKPRRPQQARFKQKSTCSAPSASAGSCWISSVWSAPCMRRCRLESDGPCALGLSAGWIGPERCCHCIKHPDWFVQLITLKPNTNCVDILVQERTQPNPTFSLYLVFTGESGHFNPLSSDRHPRARPDSSLKRRNSKFQVSFIHGRHSLELQKTVPL